MTRIFKKRKKTFYIYGSNRFAAANQVLLKTRWSIIMASGLFGKLLNLASEEVILELVRTKCTPILLYGLECFQLGKADRHSLDFTFNCLCMKLFLNWAFWCSKRFWAALLLIFRAVFLKEGRISSNYDIFLQWMVFAIFVMSCNT